jgi:hypothetical protein
MRSGNISVVIVALDGGHVVEQADGTVLARPGQVYGVRLTNHRSERAVVHIAIDGSDMTEGGLVLSGNATSTLERPVKAGENGRFTVFSEGNERVFGPDGGRSNPDLGLILVRAQWEKKPDPPTKVHHHHYHHHHDYQWYGPYRHPFSPWVIYGTNATSSDASDSLLRSSVRGTSASVTRGVSNSAAGAPNVSYTTTENASIGGASIGGEATFSPDSASISTNYVHVDSASFAPAVERAAGTGLTGESKQTFQYVVMGAMEPGETVVTLRLVVGNQQIIDADRDRAARPLPGVRVPPRPSPLP